MNVRIICLCGHRDQVERRDDTVKGRAQLMGYVGNEFILGRERALKVFGSLFNLGF